MDGADGARVRYFAADSPEGLTTSRLTFTETEYLAAVRRRGCQNIGEVMDGAKAEAASSGRKAYPTTA